MNVHWTKEEYEEYLRVTASHTGKMSSTQSSIRRWAEKENQSKEGSKESSDRCDIDITAYRRRACDPDNLCPKWYIDEIVKAGYLVDDSCKYVRRVVKEVVVIKAPEEERTVIEIYYEE